MTKADETNRHLREAILDLLSYFAIFKLTLSERDILQFLPQKASLVGVKHHLNLLTKRGKLRQYKNGRYGIKKINYPTTIKTLEYSANNTTKKMVRIIKTIPFVKSIVLSSDELLTNKKPAKVQSIIIITTPGRIYTTKDIVVNILKRLGKNSASEELECNVFFSTAGLRYSDSIAKSNLESTLWFALAKPLYGNKTWFSILKSDKFIHSQLPNFDWPKMNIKIQTSSSKFLDEHDSKRYRSYLREMASSEDFQHSNSLLRVRPDVFIAKKNHNSKIQKIHQKYLEIRKQI